MLYGFDLTSGLRCCSCCCPVVPNKRLIKLFRNYKPHTEEVHEQGKNANLAPFQKQLFNY